MASLKIPEKPICILFSHGGQEIGRNLEAKQCTTRTTKVPENCQLASFVEAGMILSGREPMMANFCKSPDARKTILEPLFLWHSVSDIDPKTATYVEYYDRPIESPYMQYGWSPMEAPKRAGAGADLGDIVFTFTSRSSSPESRLGLYVHMPNGTIHQFPPSALSEAPKNKVYLSDVFKFIQSNSDIWNPELGVALVLFSCQSYGGYEEENIWVFSNLAEKCDLLESLQQKANVEYQKVELYGRRQLREAYPVIKFPVFSDAVDRAMGFGPRKLNDVSKALMNLIEENIVPENIPPVNRKAMVEWAKEKIKYRKSLDAIPGHTSRAKNSLVEKWVKEHPPPPNPVLVAREAAMKAAAEKVVANTRKAKANAKRRAQNELQLKKEKKAYLYRYGEKGFTEKYGHPPPKEWLGGSRTRKRRGLSKTRRNK